MSQRHELTLEERQRGAHAANAAKRTKRDEARERALEELAGLTDKALARLENLLLAENDSDAYRAVKDVLDRVIGRDSKVEHTVDPIVVEHRGVKLSDIVRVAREAGVRLDD